MLRMTIRRTRLWAIWLALAITLAGCTATGSLSTLPNLAATGADAPPRSPMATPTAAGLSVRILYPKADSEVTMGQPLKFVVEVRDAQGRPVDDAQAAVAVLDPAGQKRADLSAPVGSGPAYRAGWNVPHRMPAGPWRVTVTAGRGGARATAAASFKVANSPSETFLAKYGFWIDAPTLNSIVPQVMAERGDAANGMIAWGGYAPAMHVYPENWLEVHWRTGDFGLTSPAAVRQFLFTNIGSFGFTPIREVNAFTPTRFKGWPAWRAGGRAQFWHQSVEWLVFYAPEVNKTYLLQTTVVLPPPGIDPHATLRASFSVEPGVQAAGVAPEPLPHLLPGPQLISPTLGAEFTGPERPIVLRWQPVKDLAPDEYYRVTVDYNYREGNPTLVYTTRQSEFTLPASLYEAANCQVFNWQVTLMRRTGADTDGQPTGEPLSYDSLYWYVRWSYPPDHPAPFVLVCPNAQY